MMKKEKCNMGLFDFFKKNKKQETVEISGFQFYGDGRHLKSDEEMKSIDVAAADAAFKKCKKEILDVYLKSKGFSLYKTSNYVRLNNIGLVEYINLQKEAHGSRTFCVNFCLFPLYVPHPFITIGYGDRVGTYISGRDFWWSYHDMSAAEKSFENVVAALDQYIMLWFEEHSNEDIYYNELVAKKYQLGDSHIEWAIHRFIRNNDIAGAKQLLENIKSDPQYEYVASRIRGDIDKRIVEMQELLETIQDNEQYIADVVNHNMETHKFPVSFIKQMSKRNEPKHHQKVKNMNEEELRNLQRFIGKRPQGQTDEIVIDHIKKIDLQTPLTQDEWKKLLIPCCNNGMETILQFVLGNIAELDCVEDLMEHTVYGRNVKLSEKRITVLKILAGYLRDDEKEMVLSETMLNAAWFGDTEVVKFLICIGANRDYINANGLGLVKCAERAEIQFKDSSLREFVQIQ